MMKIKFTKRATRNYNNILSYIREEWNESVVVLFKNRLTTFLKLLAKFPKIGSVEVPEKDIRGILLSKHLKIFYRIKNENIIILSLFDVRQDDSKAPG